MTSSNTPKKAPVKRGRPATGFDKNHEFLLPCLTQSGVRIDYAAVGKCEGTEAEKQGQQDNQDGNDAKENI